MNELKDLQSCFQDYILSAQPQMKKYVLGTKKVAAEKRLSIYSDAYRYRLVDILIEDYEKLFALMGEPVFYEMAMAYIDAHPSTFYSVRWFGKYLPEFLKNIHPYSEHAFLAELATFEWALTETFDAKDNPIINIEDLAQIQPNDWGSLSFSITHSLRHLMFFWNTTAIWKAIDEGLTIPENSALEYPQAWILWRNGIETLFRSLAEEEYWAFNNILCGKSFGEICEGLCEWVSEESAAFHAATMLKNWVTEGLISELFVR